jgi:hypothetical protein
VGVRVASPNVRFGVTRRNSGATSACLLLPQKQTSLLLRVHALTCRLHQLQRRRNRHSRSQRDPLDIFQLQMQAMPVAVFRLLCIVPHQDQTEKTNEMRVMPNLSTFLVLSACAARERHSAKSRKNIKQLQWLTYRRDLLLHGLFQSTAGSGCSGSNVAQYHPSPAAAPRRTPPGNGPL